jgi:hypothetical protein
MLHKIILIQIHKNLIINILQDKNTKKRVEPILVCYNNFITKKSAPVLN